MGKHGRLIAAAAAVLVAVLFAGRWAALVLTDTWWGHQIAPAAGAFLLQVHLLRLALNAVAVLIAAAWFIGNLFVVYRAVSVVQVPRYIANLEIREALTPRVLILGAAAAGLVLGLVVGLGASEWWSAVALAWHGVVYNVSEPLLNQDLGLYVAQLPLWRRLHGFALLLALLGLLLVVVMYIVVGSIRWLEGRPAISDHARRHIGLLLVAVALSLAWGYMLEPYELVAGIKQLDDAGVWRTRLMASRVLTGVALATALVSGTWGWWPKHTLVIASWAVLTAASVVGHYIAPGVARTGERAVSTTVVQRLERMAFSLGGLEVESVRPALPPPPPPPLIPWDRRNVALLDTEDDGTTLVAVSPTSIDFRNASRPVWLMVRLDQDGRVLVTGVAADRASATGTASAYRAGDTLAYPSLVTLLELPASAHHPRSPRHRIDSLDDGFVTDTWIKRVMLAWGLQVGSLLRGLPPNTSISWHLAPRIRLQRLAPFATWDVPQARIVGDELIWIANGYLSSGSFPLIEDIQWRDGSAQAVVAAFIGTVHARTGETHIYEWTADPLGTAWTALAPGVVESATALPEGLARVAPYPVGLFELQAQVLERPHWGLGRVASSRGRSQTVEPQVTWARETPAGSPPNGRGPVPHFTVAYARPGSRVISAVFEAWRQDEGPARIRLVRVDSAVGLPAPTVLETRWRRFPLHEQVRDSVIGDGASFAAGPVHYAGVRDSAGNARGVVAWQASFGSPRGNAQGRPELAWLAVAFGDRMGAGRDPTGAWQNLLGETAPVPPGTAPANRFDEARRWMLRADTALRAGRWEEFGRAFEALRQLFNIPPDRGSDQ